VRSVVAADPFPPTGSRLHVADWLASTLSNVDISVPDGWDAAPWLSVPKEVGAAVGDVPMRPRRVAIVHPGSGSPRKRWPVDRWQAAIRALILDGWSVTVLEGEADGAVVAAVLDGLPPGRVGEVEVARHEGIGVVAGRLATASLVVANDSGIAHLAAGVGAPVVAVFGPTDPATWRPRGPRVAVVGGTPGATWPHASSTLPDVEIAWPEVAEMLLAVKRVAPALPADAPLGPLREGASS
jgi:ADP-heptose:LPS heptosyltransferase